MLILTTIISLPQKPLQISLTVLILLGFGLLIGLKLIMVGKAHYNDDLTFSGVILMCISGTIAVFLLPHYIHYPENYRQYENDLNSYNQIIKREQNTPIAKTYENNKGYYLVLDNKENTVLEIDQNTYEIISKGEPLKRYVGKIKESDSTDDSL